MRVLWLVLSLLPFLVIFNWFSYTCQSPHAWTKPSAANTSDAIPQVVIPPAIDGSDSASRVKHLANSPSLRNATSAETSRLLHFSASYPNGRTLPPGLSLAAYESTERAPRIYDCVMFFQELAMMQFRFHELNASVDFFIISESTHTHTGGKKKLLFWENRHLFDSFWDKVVYAPVYDTPLKKEHVAGSAKVRTDKAFSNQIFHRNAIQRGLPSRFHAQDIIMLHDVDEIPNPALLDRYRRDPSFFGSRICVFPMDMYYYSMRFHPFMEVWRYRGAISPNYLRSKKEFWRKFDYAHGDCPGSDLRCGGADKRRLVGTIREPSMTCNGGWHLSYFGSEQFIRNKLNNLGAQFLNTEKVRAGISTSLRTGADLFGRGEERRPAGVYPRPKYIGMLEKLLNDTMYAQDP